MASERIKKEFYINTEGKIVKLKGSPDDWVSIHAGIAGEVMSDESGKATDTLYNLGWIAWGSRIYGCKIKGKPTQAQINTVFDLGFIMDDRGEIRTNNLKP